MADGKKLGKDSGIPAVTVTASGTASQLRKDPGKCYLEVRVGLVFFLGEEVFRDGFRMAIVQEPGVCLFGV